MARWRLAHALEVLRDEVNAEWPDRSKASDGTLGDASHAARVSDHNPALYPGAGPTPVVRAMDITVQGIDHVQYRERIRALGKAGDSRLNPNGYVISDRRIASAQHEPAWEWHPYTGTNPHDHHVHVSVGTNPRGFDSSAPWGIYGGTTSPIDDPEADDMFTEQDRADIAAIKRALLIDVASGADDATQTQARGLGAMLRSLLMGEYGEADPKYLKGSLGWLDRRLSRLRRLIVHDVLEALGHDVAPSPDDDGS